MKYILWCLLLISIYSCHTEITKKKYVKSNLPDSIVVNDTLEGIITFTLPLDSVKLNEGDERLTFLYMTKQRKPVLDYDKFRFLSNIDTFATVEKKTFFYYSSFNKTGKFYLSGFIEDILYVDFIDANNKEMTRRVTTLVRVIDSVVVVESPLGNGILP